MMNTQRRTVGRKLANAASVGLLLAASGQVFAQAGGGNSNPGWELRVCSPSNTMPFSHRDGTGFENRIAEIIADEMGATLSFDWHLYNTDLFNLRFSEGTCDVIMGVPDGMENALNTLTYYQSPYVEVYRADSGLDISSMDDPALADLTMAVQGIGTPPHQALLQRGLSGNVAKVFGGEDGEDHLARMVEAVATGEFDIGFGWGPVIGYYAAQSDVELVVKPVEPAFDLPSVFQFQPMTMAVRPFDEAMQARLNRAIVARWSDIQEVLAEYNVPLMDSVAPVAGEPRDHSRVLRVGVLLPIPTGANTHVSRTYDLVGEAGRRGALLAESLASQRAGAGSMDVALVFSSTPSAEAAERAAQAMVALGEVDALVGGMGDGQADVIARIAAEAGIPFINIGTTELALHEQCQPTTFHVQPSAATYIQALVDVHGPLSATGNWYAIVEDDDEGAAMLQVLRTQLAAAEQVLTGDAAVGKSRPVYFDLLDEAVELGADTVFLGLDPADQIALIGQAEDYGYELNFAPFPNAHTQTREYLASNLLYGAGADVPRIQLWDPALDNPVAQDLSERYGGAWGEPFDAPAWSAFEGVSVLVEAARLADSKEPAAVMAALPEVDAGAVGGKEASQHFDPVTRELAQNLYVTSINPENDWSIRLSSQLGAGTLEQVLEPISTSDGSCGS